MLKYIERSTIHYLHQKGWTNTQIAKFLGRHRDTIARVLRELLGQQPASRHRQSAVAVFAPQIQAWLDQKLTVRCMLELAGEDPDHPYLGSVAAFYDNVRPLRRARMRVPATVAVRFEGRAGEFLRFCCIRMGGTMGDVNHVSGAICEVHSVRERVDPQGWEDPARRAAMAVQ